MAYMPTGSLNEEMVGSYKLTLQPMDKIIEFFEDFIDEGIISIEGKEVCLLKQPCHCGNSEDQLNSRFFLDSRI